MLKIIVVSFFINLLLINAYKPLKRKNFGKIIFLKI